jgi:hypothetical protein
MTAASPFALITRVDGFLGSAALPRSRCVRIGRCNGQ